MAKHIILENGCPVNIESISIAYKEDKPVNNHLAGSPIEWEPGYYMKITGVGRPIAITEKDFRAICDTIKKEDCSGKEVTAEISRLTQALRNLYELLRARMR
jgi:hypothetical protein